MLLLLLLVLLVTPDRDFQAEWNSTSLLSCHAGKRNKRLPVAVDTDESDVPIAVFPLYSACLSRGLSRADRKDAFAEFVIPHSRIQLAHPSVDIFVLVFFFPFFVGVTALSAQAKPSANKELEPWARVTQTTESTRPSPSTVAMALVR